MVETSKISPAQSSIWFAACLLTCWLWSGLPTSNAEEPLSFARDILPILSANRFACHGPDEADRQGELRLDLEADAKRAHGDGTPIVPGDLQNSTLWTRITSHDSEIRMPPPKAHRTLSKSQIETLRRWILAGAAWQQHWSFEPLRARPKPPGVEHPIDTLVREQLAKRNLQLQPTAPPATLVRRLSLDLIGLPPTLEQAERFAADPSPVAYEKLVDELLQSPRFGEHWTRMWLDLARYADTKGYEKDLGRTMWPYRDWVVAAFNADMPLDQFTQEQLAGDLLPNATQSQRVATAFHRNTLSNDEAGTDDEEFRTVAVKDRIDTTIQVWMGLTMGCAKCHSHKYDPISHADYYRFFALFNQTEDTDRGDDAPKMALLNPQQAAKREPLEKQIRALEAEIAVAETTAPQNATPENSPWKFLSPLEVTAHSKAKLNVENHQVIRVSGPAPKVDLYTILVRLPVGKYTALRLEVLPDTLADGQLAVGRNEADPNFVLSELKIERVLSDGKAEAVALHDARADFSQEKWPVAHAIDGKPSTGWAVSPRSREKHEAIFVLEKPLEIATETQIRIILDQQYGERLTLRKFRLSMSEAAPDTLKLLEENPELRALRDRLAATRAELSKITSTPETLPILRELPADKQRVTKIHKRGNFLDPGGEVSAAVLPAFGKLPAAAPLNRLGVAQWLVNAENPLTPRVWANRIWARLFGQGIVETEEDFGALGSPPSNPELLDWLASEYRDGGWSLKKLLKKIVLSETYRQSSAVSAASQEMDPQNALISRGARFRLPAEVIRDQALAVAGLLSEKMSGPPVMPPQPDGLWRSTYSGQKWVNAEGEDRYRRGLYTYLKRTTPYPSFTTFDAGSGEVCQIRRIRTNTPLQSLITLNDPVYLEASAALAQQMIARATLAPERAERGLRLALIRSVAAEEITPLIQLQADAQRAFANAPDQAQAFVTHARAKAADIKAEELAAWVLTANAILNLDEFLNRN